jgi:hypothetical protein
MLERRLKLSASPGLSPQGRICAGPQIVTRPPLTKGQRNSNQKVSSQYLVQYCNSASAATEQKGNLACPPRPIISPASCGFAANGTSSPLPAARLIARRAAAAASIQEYFCSKTKRNSSDWGRSCTPRGRSRSTICSRRLRKRFRAGRGDVRERRSAAERASVLARAAGAHRAAMSSRSSAILNGGFRICWFCFTHRSLGLNLPKI